jgi:maleylpyruvate isomerase
VQGRMTTRAWLDAATTLLFEAVDGLDDARFASASTLPNWTNAHIVAHLHFNAEAIGRLVSWARTGVETPMYSSAEQRCLRLRSCERCCVHPLMD